MGRAQLSYDGQSSVVLALRSNLEDWKVVKNDNGKTLALMTALTFSGPTEKGFLVECRMFGRSSKFHPIAICFDWGFACQLALESSFEYLQKEWEANDRR